MTVTHSKIAWLRVDCAEHSDRKSHLDFCEQQEVIDFIKSHPEQQWPDAVVSAPGSDVPCYDELIGYLQGLDKKIPLFIYDEKSSQDRTDLAKDLGAADYYGRNLCRSQVIDRVEFHLTAQGACPKEAASPVTQKGKVAKRLFDIIVSLTLLLLFTPLFLLVALAIRLESKGKVFYFQPRVGQNYQIFKFFKFRSMRVNADKMVTQLQNVNPYQQPEETPVEAQQPTDDVMLLDNDGLVPENEFLIKKSIEDEKAFFKVHNDPRITKVGHFIRKTSIDELPQLVNVLLGDMSIVGNRPLPLYEAEKLTSDEWATRFLAPAGITGLWQVTERGKKDVSADSRKRLDIEYATKSSFWTDMWILLKTPMAAIQQENC